MQNSYTEASDFLMLAALPEEFSSLRSVFDQEYESKLIEQSDIGRIYSATIKTRKNTKLKGIIACPERVGRLNSAILTAYILAKSDFRIVGLTGLAGALHPEKRINMNINNRLDEPTLGDVIFADSIIDVDMGRLSDANSYNYSNSDSLIITRPRTIHIDIRLCKIFESLKSHKSEFYNPVEFRNIHRMDESNPPRGFIGQFLSTNMVVASRDQAINLAKHSARHSQRMPIAVEMESYGVAQASRMINNNVPVFVIKSVNDYANSDKRIDEHNWRSRACDNAAIVSRNFLSYLHEKL